MGDRGFRAGVGRVVITPPLTAPHAGWGAQVHVLPDGVEADLWATALVVDDEPHALRDPKGPRGGVSDQNPQDDFLDDQGDREQGVVIQVGNMRGDEGIQEQPQAEHHAVADLSREDFAAKKRDDAARGGQANDPQAHRHHELTKRFQVSHFTTVGNESRMPIV